MTIAFRAGSCLDIFGAEPDASFDAFVSDWPAGVAFMSRKWDTDHGGRDAWVKVWSEVAAMMLRKAKPGAYSLTWALPRTSGWTSEALERGGWIVQDVVTHVFGQGWPKGRAALKPASEHWILARKGSGGALQIDAARVARGERMMPTIVDKGIANEWGGLHNRGGAEAPTLGSWPPNFALSHCPECEERGTRRVRGGANDSVSKAREGTIYGAQTDRKGHDFVDANGLATVPAFDCLAACDCGASVLAASGGEPPRCACGRAMWWACPVAEMDAQSGHLQSGSSDGFVGEVTQGNAFGAKLNRLDPAVIYADSGGASRFFPRFTYAAKASGGERHAGCDGLLWRADKRSPFGFVRVSREEWEALPEMTLGAADQKRGALGNDGRSAAHVRARGNVHPTVKSLALMEWLVALVCPPGGRLGDVTCGSGGTLLALDRLNTARGLGASALGCDICPEAIEIAEARLAWWRANTAVQAGLFGEATVIEPEARKPSAPKPATPAAPPKVDPRQGALFT